MSSCGYPHIPLLKQWAIAKWVKLYKITGARISQLPIKTASKGKYYMMNNNALLDALQIQPVVAAA
ncbi:MAG: hypothetical protein RR087_10910, partial [Oscillospiraceae bacterium]